ncbi:hypothetical protein QL285_045582 [Trifolium repens]|nr:hypothetical protein QL285_045582 [Trifolium repens]
MSADSAEFAQRARARRGELASFAAFVFASLAHPKDLFCSRTQMGFSVSSVAEGFVAVAELRFSDKASELISIQVDRLTGARTGMELMIGARLGSSH